MTCMTASSPPELLEATLFPQSVPSCSATDAAIESGKQHTLSTTCSENFNFLVKNSALLQCNRCCHKSEGNACSFLPVAHYFNG